MNRVVVTGLGIISSIGNTIDNFWNSLQKGVSGIDWIQAFDTTDFKAKVAGESKDFNPTDYMDKKEARRTSRFVQLSIASSKMCFEDSLLTESDFDIWRAGVIYGIGLGGMDMIESQHKNLLERGPGRVSPFMIPMTIANMSSGTLAIKYGFRGINITMVTACASSTNALGEAFKMIKEGRQDIIMSGGTEAVVTPLSVAGFDSLGALSRKSPDKACRPFDKDRDGFVMAEGSGTLLLENYEHAKKRGAKIYAEIVGYGSTDDACHITAPDESGTGAMMAMKEAVEEAGITPEEVDYINAHGTSTPLNDIMETRAIKKLFGRRESLSISSTKSMTGHCLGGAGAVEAIASILAMNKSIVPPTINLAQNDPLCDLNYTPNNSVEKEINYALSNSFGFGGHNASLLLKKII
jgi:3-oxoacyl-[acyl-carrier-protein] synthase II